LHHQIDHRQRESGVRELVGEAVAVALLVAVMFASSTLLVPAGASAGRVLLGSVALGVGCGLVIWSFGAICRPQLHPLVSILGLVVRAQGWRGALARVVAQAVGAATATLAIAAYAPPAAAFGPARVASPAFAEGVVAFLFAFVALSIAHCRDARVPIAIGAIAVSSFWMTGQPTLGNPVLLAASAFVGHASLRGFGALLGGSVCGFAVGAVSAFALQPKARESARVLLFAPRDERGENAR
jgi:glycerol uptake facilitator-like aquaporin